jgi:hypothetical protein
MKPNYLYKLLLILIFAAGAVRFWKIPELGYFMMDEERDAFLVRRMLVDRRPLLIGGSIPGGINVGPLFFYISAIPFAMSGLNPLGPAWAAAAIGIIGVIGVFVVGKELFGRRVGLLAAVFAGFSLVNIVYQRPWWPLTLSQLVTLVAYLALWNLIRSDPAQRGRTFKTRWMFVLVGALIVGAQSDPSTLSLIPLSIFWLWRHKGRIKLTGKHYLAAAGLFVLAHTTWFIFELRHDFLNMRVFAGLFSSLFQGPTLAYAKVGPYRILETTVAAVYRLFIPTGPLDVTKQISPAPEFLVARMDGIWWPAAWAGLLVISSYIIGSLVNLRFLKTGAVASKVKKNLEAENQNSFIARRILSVHFLISLMGILVYTTVFPGYVHEWMWFFMFPAFFLMAADIMILFSKKVQPYRVAPFVAATVVVWVVWQFSLFLKLDNAAGLGKKLAVVKAAQAEIAGRPYELRSEGEEALRYGGWRYLFTLHGDPPVKSYMDYVYQGWVYPKSEVKPEVVVYIRNNLENWPDFTISEHSENSESRITPENQRI